MRLSMLAATAAMVLTGAALSPAIIPSKAQAASFNCAAARAPDERAICSSLSLNDQDVRMAQLYDITRHLVAMGGRGAIMDRQVE